MITPEQKDRIEFILKEASLSETMAQGIRLLVSNQRTPLTVSQGDAVIKKLETLYPTAAALYEESKQDPETQHTEVAVEDSQEEDEPFTVESFMNNSTSNQAGEIYIESWLESFETALTAVMEQWVDRSDKH